MNDTTVTVRLTAERRSGLRALPAGSVITVEWWKAARLVERGLAVPVNEHDEMHTHEKRTR